MTRTGRRLRDLAVGQGQPEPAVALGAADLLGPPQQTARDSFIRGLTDGYGIPAETARHVPITGNTSKAADRLAEYADAGVSHLVVGLVGEDWPAQCDLLAQARAALPGEQRLQQERLVLLLEETDLPIASAEMLFIGIEEIERTVWSRPSRPPPTA